MRAAAASRRPKSSPAKVRDVAREAEPAFLPSLDNINVPTISLLSADDLNRRAKGSTGGGVEGKRRASSAESRKAKSRAINSTTPEQVSFLKEQVQFERQFMTTKLRSGGSDEQTSAEASLTRKSKLTATEGKLTAMQRQNARLKSKTDKLEANKQLFESTQEHIEAAVSGERLRRKNLEGNIKAWEKERRDMLREARERRRQVEHLENQLQQSSSDLAQHENEGEQLKAELDEALRTVAALQEADGRHKMEQQALIKALALAKEQRTNAIRERDEQSAEVSSLREEVGQLQC
eukprot:COSAG02_NODE_17457_length_1001_cov_102.700665_1_plen_292_part_10